MSTKKIILNDTALPIREFELEWMCPNPSICMIAKRGSGKSWICRSILKHFSYLPGGTIIAPTDRMSSFYGKFFPDSYIHYTYSTELVERILGRQRIIIKKMKDKFKSHRKCDPRAFLVMDDCLSSKGSWLKDELIMELFFNGRHYLLMYIMTMQFPLGITPELRGNFDYIFVLADDYISNQKRIYDHYAGMFPNFNAFRQVFVELTKDYGSMVIVNRGSNKNFLNKIFHFKASKEHFDTIGCQQFRWFHKTNYNPKWEDKIIPFDIEKYTSSRKKTQFHVAKMYNDNTH